MTVWPNVNVIASGSALRPDLIRTLRRSAGFQPAASPISNRQSVARPARWENFERPRAGSPAIQQVGNLRYEFVHRSARHPSMSLFLAVFAFLALLAAKSNSLAESSFGPFYHEYHLTLAPGQ